MRSIQRLLRLPSGLQHQHQHEPARLLPPVECPLLPLGGEEVEVDFLLVDDDPASPDPQPFEVTLDVRFHTKAMKGQLHMDVIGAVIALIRILSWPARALARAVLALGRSKWIRRLVTAAVGVLLGSIGSHIHDWLHHLGLLPL